MLVSDARRVEQVLLNLLNNAIKFTEQGSVRLTAETVPDGSIQPNSSLSISIADTGIGYQVGRYGQTVSAFRQIDTGLSRQHEGTGLGLAICRAAGGFARRRSPRSKRLGQRQRLHPHTAHERIRDIMKRNILLIEERTEPLPHHLSARIGRLLGHFGRRRNAGHRTGGTRSGRS